MKLHIKQLLLLLSAVFLLSGCKKTDELDTYKANMAQFFDNITVYDSNINSLDPGSDTAVTDLLSYLDSMNTTFSQMASLTVPDGFPGVDQLADEASEYMSQAVILYHQAFESDPFDSATASLAKQNYDRANVRIKYILQILHGDIPEEIYSTIEDSNFFDTGSGNTEQTQEAASEAIRPETESYVEEGNVFADDYYDTPETTTSAD